MKPETVESPILTKKEKKMLQQILPSPFNHKEKETAFIQGFS